MTVKPGLESWQGGYEGHTLKCYSNLSHLPAGGCVGQTEQQAEGNLGLYPPNFLVNMLMVDSVEFLFKR